MIKLTYYTYYSSPIGEILVLSFEGFILGIYFEGQKNEPIADNDEYQRRDNEPTLLLATKWLKAYFNGEKPSVNHIPIKLSGTDFQKAVWEELIKIPYGKTICYSDLAKTLAEKMGKSKMSARAIGGAVGKNPVSIIVPCHRVIGKNKSLVGYAGKISRKEYLLHHEGAGFLE